MNGWNLVITLSEIRKLLRLLQPCCFKQWIKCIFSTSIDYTRTNNKNFYILFFKSQNFIFQLFDPLILWQWNSRLIIWVLPKSVLNLFLFLWFLFLSFLFFNTFVILIILIIIIHIVFRLFFIFLFLLSALLLILLINWRWRILSNFSLRIAPYHNVTYKYESFVILERFFHHFESELNILHVSLIDIVDINLALFSCLFSK